MQHTARTHGEATTIALLCPALRLRRIVRLVLEAAGYPVVDWDDPTRPPRRVPAAVVADLDSLGWVASEAPGRLSAAGIAPATPVLLISVYPHLPNGLAYLQPPFGPDELVARVRGLLPSGGAHL